MNRFSSKFQYPFESWMIIPLGCALAVMGAKIWMIADYGSSTPFWDQWDAEGAVLYPKYFNGSLSFLDLISTHNEHRILLTRLWSLLLLNLEGYWDPLLQILANTMILASFVALLVIAFRPILNRVSWMALALFTAATYALPFAWENTLMGMCSAFYLVLLISLAGMVAIINAAAFTLRWWLAVLLLITSYFCMASGALTLAAACAVCVLQLAVGQRSGFLEWTAIAILASVTLLTMFYIPILPGHAPLKAHTIGQFLRSLMEIVSWPATVGHGGIAILILGGILIQAPSVFVSIRLIALRLPLNDYRWFLVALTGWTELQAASVAYGRAAGALSSRYLDIFAVGLPLNLACLLYLLSTSQSSRQRRGLAYGAITIWLLLVFFGATKAVFTRALPEMAEKRVTSEAQTANLRAYLDTGNISTLENKPFLSIPYPDAQGLASIASQPVIRALLPATLVGQASVDRAQQHGLARFTGHLMEALKKYALRWGVLLLPAGLTLFLIGLLGLTNQRPKTEAKFSSASE